MPHPLTFPLPLVFAALYDHHHNAPKHYLAVDKFGHALATMHNPNGHLSLRIYYFILFYFYKAFQVATVAIPTFLCVVQIV